MRKTPKIEVFSTIFVLVLLLSVIPAQNNVINLQNNKIRLQSWKIVKDQNPSGKMVLSADSSWVTLNSIKVENFATGNWLIQTNYMVEDTIDSKTGMGLFVYNLISAFEIYVDGKLVIKNGTVGNNIKEVSGKYNVNIALRDEFLTQGNHNIVVRISNFNNFSKFKWYQGDVYIMPFDSWYQSMYKYTVKAFFIAGLLVIPLIFNLFLFFSRKKKIEHFVLSLICVFVITDYLIGQIPYFTDVKATFVFWEYSYYYWEILIVSTLLPVFFISIFSFSKKFILFTVLLNLLVFLLFTNQTNYFTVFSNLTLIESILIIVFALFKKKEESILLFIGIIISSAGFYIGGNFILLITMLVVCSSISIARQFVKTEKAEKEAIIRNIRLENELIKKNINPHFILNTLTSVIVWLRKDVNSAIKLVESLAEEFRTVMQISPLKLIPIQQELDLCNTHLRIMNFRKGSNFVLETDGIELNENVPPMIFHTMIENGLSHGFENKTSGVFLLKKEIDGKKTKFLLSNDGEFLSNVQKGSTGFGLKYVRARLEENYPGKWSCISQKTSTGWETIIEINEG